MKRETLATLGRILLLVAGICFVTYLVHHAGPARVAQILSEASIWLPLVILCEIGMVTCDVMCIRTQFGTHAAKIPLRAWIWSSTYAYGLQILFPAGRAAAEVARISVLQKHVGVARCAVSSVGLQASNLYAVSAISGIHALISFFFTDARSQLLCLGEVLNVVVVGAIATFVTLMLRSKRAAAFISKRFKLSDASKDELADATQNSLTIRKGALWCFGGRFIQFVQYGICVTAIGGASGIVAASLAHGTQLVGASVGDMIPGQMGAVEGFYTMFAEAIHLTQERVLALPLLVRATQITLAITCLVIATVMGRKKKNEAPPAEEAAPAPSE